MLTSTLSVPSFPALFQQQQQQQPQQQVEKRFLQLVLTVRTH